MCAFNFTLRETDTYYMSGSGSKQLTVFESGDIKSDDIEVHYYPISAENAGYADIASRYREYLMEEKGVTAKAKENSAPLYIDLYGGVQKKCSVLGIPLTMKTAVTSYEQGEDILRELKEAGITFENSAYQVVAVDIDSRNNYDMKTSALTKYAIIKIITEAFDGVCHVEIIDNDWKELILILNLDNEQSLNEQIYNKEPVIP